jgi:hypothetical protein
MSACTIGARRSLDQRQKFHAPGGMSNRRGGERAELSSIAGSAERAQAFEIAADERFLFRPRPALQLRLALTRLAKRRIDFDSQDCKRRIELGRPAGLACDVVIQTLLQVNRSADVRRP